MKHVIDQDKVNKYSLFSNIGSITGLLILLGSVLLPVFVSEMSVLSAVLKSFTVAYHRQVILLQNNLLPLHGNDIKKPCKCICNTNLYN